MQLVALVKVYDHCASNRGQDANYLQWSGHRGEFQSLHSNSSMQNFQSYKLESFAASLIDIEVLYAFPNKIKLKEKKSVLERKRENEGDERDHIKKYDGVGWCGISETIVV